MNQVLNVVVIITATLDCNKDCPWCLRKELNKKYNLSLEKMSIETMKKIMANHQQINSFVLTGGEPMLNLPLIDFLLSENKEVKISTNGSIKIPEDRMWWLEKQVFFDISMNSLTRPPLYQQLLDLHFPADQIRLFIYLDKNYQNVIDIVNTVGNDKFAGYEILPEMWIDKDQEYEQFIKEVSPLFAELHRRYHKDDGYESYLAQQFPQLPRLKVKYSPQGEIISDLWTQGLPEKERREKKKHIYEDGNVIRTGMENFKKGIDAFNMPVEYYTCLMYETMRETLAAN